MHCTSCGIRNTENARYCTSCGQSMNLKPQPPSPISHSQDNRPDRGLQTAAMILGLIAATTMLLSGCAAFFTGTFVEAVEETFNSEVESNEEGNVSTSTELSIAGAFAILTALALFIAGGISIAARRTSLILYLLILPCIIALVFVDTYSLFAIAYYFSIVAVGTATALLIAAIAKHRRQAKDATANT